MEKKRNDIGLIGLAVMGENLVLNMESKGFNVSVYNRSADVTEKFISGRAKGKNIEGFYEIKDFVNSLESPRLVMMMVRAGSAVDSVIESLIPHLSNGDIIIDGGNSNFEDTNRRVAYVQSKGLYYIGAGVSGGEEGALKGPSIMPGGSLDAWSRVAPIFDRIAARADDGSACSRWIGPEGSGHFVKMVHNGIEYGDMQIIAEAYSLLKRLPGYTNEKISEVFSKWNSGKPQSYLLEITSHIVNYKDSDGDGYLIDKILDAAGQKGTGKWSVVNSLEMGTPLNLISSAVYERSLSSRKELRVKASKIYGDGYEVLTGVSEDDIMMAMYASKLVSYAQGFDLMKEASVRFGWNLNMSDIAKSWRNGCIIRSIFLDRIAEAYDRDSSLDYLLFDKYFKDQLVESSDSWRRVVAQSLLAGVSVPAFSAALNFWLSLKSANLPANLIQAQRDMFGAHNFERVDRPRGEFFHENWTGEGGDTNSGVYLV